MPLFAPVISGVVMPQPSARTVRAASGPAFLGLPVPGSGARPASGRAHRAHADRDATHGPVAPPQAQADTERVKAGPLMSALRPSATPRLRSVDPPSGEILGSFASVASLVNAPVRPL
jgi:hypothetical protein